MIHDGIGQMLSRASSDLNQPSTSIAREFFAYEPGGKVAIHTNAIAGVTRTFYTTTGLPRIKQNPDGSVQQWFYDLLGRTILEVLSNGSSWQTIYQDDLRTVTRIFRNSSSQVLAATQQKFDYRGNVVQNTDSEGHSTFTEYDDLDRPKQTLGPATSGQSPPGQGDQQKNLYTYDNVGKILITENALGEKTRITSDVLGRVVESAVFNSLSAIQNIVSTRYSDDHHSVITSAGTGYDAVHTTTFTDTFGKPVLTRTGFSGAFTSSECDIVGNLIAARDELGRTTRFSYDALNRKISDLMPDGAITTYSYDPAGNLLRRNMPDNLSWIATYDIAGRMKTQELTRNSQTTRRSTYQYYTAAPWIGLLQSVTDSRGFIHTATYDDFLRPSQSVSTASGSSAPLFATSYQYDRRGLVTNLVQTSAGSPSTTVERQYNAYGQIIDEKVKVNNVIERHMIQKWDAAGRRNSLGMGSTLHFQDQGFAISINFNHRADGLLASVVENGGRPYNFEYGDNGLLQTRSNPWRSASIDRRDDRGRILQSRTTVNDFQPLRENLVWTSDSKISNHYIMRQGEGTYNEDRSYLYQPDRNYLISETLNPVAHQTATQTHQYDFSQSGKLGILTSSILRSSFTNSWSVPSHQIDAFLQPKQETIALSKKFHRASGRAPGALAVTATLDNQPLPDLIFDSADPEGKWHADLELTSGSHTLQGKAQHPSGKYEGIGTSAFTVTNLSQTVSNTYDSDGNLTSRNLGDNRTQTLTWDPLGRLVKVIERDLQNNGYDWTALYDSLGRRLRTTYTPVSQNLPVSDGLISLDSWLDPQIEFLEIGLHVKANGIDERYWKIHGPDLNGVYGGLQGTGGLEAIVHEKDGQAIGVLQDIFGNHAGALQTGGKITWSETKVSGYGPLPGFTLPSIERSSSANLPSSICYSAAWRGRRTDPTGYICLGARYYNPTAGRFLSADPLGHASCMDLYSYAHGDPVNRIDPTGRFGVAAAQITYQDGLLAGVKYAGQGLENWGGQSSSGWLSGASSFVGNSLSSLSGVAAPSSYVNGYVGAVNNTSMIMGNSMDRGNSGAVAFGEGALHQFNSFAGSEQLMSAGFGVDVARQEAISGSERLIRGTQGFAQASGLALGLTAGFSPAVTTKGTAPILGSLTPSQARTIQAFSERFGAEVNVVGSRAAGTAGQLSDFDYVIGGNASLRNSAGYYLPRGAAGGELRGGLESGIDIFNANRTPLDQTRPFIQFTPGKQPVVGPKP
jgi:RHS repeat-associated protein